MIFETILGILLVTAGKIAQAHGDSTRVFTPSNSTSPAAGLIILPGAYIGSDAYIPLGKSIQTSSPYRLWVATVGGWLANLVNPVQMSSKVEDAKQQMMKAGLPQDAVIFIAAHSLGGVFLDMFVRGNTKAATGIILFGSYINKGVKLAQYPVPVLTISGDTDGLCRLTRIGRDYQQLNRFEPKTPVILVPGVNHSQIASGPMPSNVLNNDIPAKLTYKEAHDQLAMFTNAFMVLNGKGCNDTAETQAEKLLRNQHTATGDIVSVYLQATTMDHGNKPAWAIAVQTLLANMTSPSQYKLNVLGKEVGVTGQLSMVPDIQKVDNNTVNVTVPYYTQEPINPLDESLVHDSPDLTSTVAWNQEALKKYIPNSQFNQPVHSCNFTSYFAFSFAGTTIPAEYAIRYKQRGKKIKFEEDNVKDSLAEWLVAGIEWRQDGDSVSVSLPYYEDKGREMIYCKVVTMSRAIEYIMIDSLKKKSV